MGKLIIETVLDENYIQSHNDKCKLDSDGPTLTIGDNLFFRNYCAEKPNDKNTWVTWFIPQKNSVQEIISCIRNLQENQIDYKVIAID